MVDESEEMVKANMAQSAVEKLRHTPEDAWVDAGVFGLQLAGERIAEARKRAGLTQQQLAGQLSVPRSQISQIECKPNRSTARTLKKIARVLKVDVAPFLHGISTRT